MCVVCDLYYMYMCTVYMCSVCTFCILCSIHSYAVCVVNVCVYYLYTMCSLGPFEVCKCSLYIYVYDLCILCPVYTGTVCVCSLCAHVWSSGLCGIHSSVWFVFKLVQPCG